MNKLYTTLSIFFVLAVLMTSCTNNENGAFTAKPTALGKLNKITVVSDKAMWEGAIKDSFLTYFGASYPVMPQPEPIFDIRHFTTLDLSAEPLRKNLRIYVILSDLSDKDSPTTKMLIADLGEEKFQKVMRGEDKLVSAGINKWANKQLVIYLYGRDEAELAKSIKTNFSKVAKRINQHDIPQLRSTTFALKTNHVLTNEVLDRYGIKMKIPGDYKEAQYDTINNVSWFRKDAKSGILNIAIQSEKYTSEKQLSKEYILKMRDKFGKQYVSTPEPNTYMISNTTDLPVYQYTHQYGNMHTVEIRGIWEIVNDFVGGAYISYALYNKSKGEIVYIDCFVMRQGKSKRDLMQQMEYIVSAMEGV